MFDLSTATTLQGANSTTFRRPPLDGSLTIPEVYAFHADNSPKHPLFVYPDENNEVRTIFYPEAYRGIRRAAKFVSSHTEEIQDKYVEQMKQRGSNTSTIGILATADSITFHTFIVGIMHAGLVAFPISTRNSAAAVAHLIQKTGILQLFVSCDAAIQRLSHSARELLVGNGIHVDIISIPQYADLYNNLNDYEGVKIVKRCIDDMALIIHSSGSTAFPKPIEFTHRTLFHSGLAPYYGELDVCGLVLAVHALPLFHMLGCASVASTIANGTTAGCFKPSSPPVIPTADILLKAIEATHCDIIISVPAFIETWSHVPENLPKLKAFKAIVYAGAPMNKTVGDKLFAAGVPLVSTYAMTESSVLTMFYPDMLKQLAWDHFRLSPAADLELVPQEGSPDIFEPLILETSLFPPKVYNTTVRGLRAYATNDLLQAHPTLPGYYRVYGRVDDQIMLSTGEKTNPVPLESIFNTDPRITAALMFGRGRFQNGVLIQPKEQFDPSDEQQLATFRNKIWPTVEKVNEFAPSHSRIFKEMIIVTSPSKPFEMTAKGTPRRQVCINAYEDEIDALYKAVTDSSQVDLPIPVSWTRDSTLEFVRVVVNRVMKSTLADDDDLFQQGCDSLQATWIRNTLIHALRSSTTVGVHDFPYSVVYANPSTQALSDFVFGFVAKGKESRDTSSVESKATEMRGLVQKYGASLAFGKRFDTPLLSIRDDMAVVLLTGTTGRLGCHLLSQLLQMPDVERVFALNRDLQGSQANMELRQRDAFRGWGLDVGLLDSTKLVLLICDLTKEDLGLGQKYQEIRDSVTAIIHNAWRVDFNLALTSFEPLIVGVRNLLNLSLTSPRSTGPRIVSVSSIGAVRNPPSSPVPEVSFLHPKVAMGAGYGESKWVAEQLFARASKEANLRATVVRVGQLSGDTRIGGWNTKEWVCALVSAGQALGCIPSRKSPVSWLPVDVAASALLDMLSSTEPVLHLVHPRPVEWDSVFAAVAERLGVPLVLYSEWLALLEAEAASSTNTRDAQQHNTAMTLLEFFRSVGSSDGPEEMQLSTEKALQCSRTLSQLLPLQSEYIIKSVEYWAKAGVLKL